MYTESIYTMISAFTALLVSHVQYYPSEVEREGCYPGWIPLDVFAFDGVSRSLPAPVLQLAGPCRCEAGHCRCEDIFNILPFLEILGSIYSLVHLMASSAIWMVSN